MGIVMAAMTVYHGATVQLNPSGATLSIQFPTSPYSYPKSFDKPVTEIPGESRGTGTHAHLSRLPQGWCSPGVLSPLSLQGSNSCAFPTQDLHSGIGANVSL